MTLRLQVAARNRTAGQFLVAASAIVLMFCGIGSAQQAADTNSPPQLRKVGPVTQLFVNDKPFLILGGELGNSTASDLNVLDQALSKCRRMNLNTIMLPVYWDLIEPTEGQFDFTLVQGAIDEARAHKLHLVFLWYGTWKNSMSCYVPSWMKRDTARFERVKTSAGEAEEIITPESSAACDADAEAFSALMRWTRQYDSEKQTVLMVQVENEVGMIPEARDHSEMSEAAYRGQVPSKLLSLATSGNLGPEVEALWDKAGRKTSGTWSQIFGPGPLGEEVFSAWEISTYVEKVAAAGKREYPLPMFANAALIRSGALPGQYPGAGPLPHLLEVWHSGAPTLDMICPDIYFPNFMEWCGRYVRDGNPLFIPEMADSARACGNAVYAAGRFNAIGFGPFSIENADEDKSRQITNCYNLLSGMSDRIEKSQENGTILGFSPLVGFDWSTDSQPQRGQLGGIIFTATFDAPSAGGNSQTSVLPTLGAGRWDAPPQTPRGSALVVQLGSEEFAVLGMGVIITFAPADGRGKIGIDRVQEGRFAADGTWIGGRWLNGDETHQGRHLHLYDGQWSVQRMTVYRY